MQLAGAILHPERLGAVGALSEQQIREMWPPEVAQRAFVDCLRGQYDHTQLGAIEVLHRRSHSCHGAALHVVPFTHALPPTAVSGHGLLCMTLEACW